MKLHSKLKREKVEFCGHTLYLQQYCLRTWQNHLEEMDELRKASPEDLRTAYFLSLKYVLVDEHGEPVLNDVTDLDDVLQQDVEALVLQSSKLNGFVKDEQKKS